MNEEIKGVNLFEVNGIQYTDNIPDNINIGVTKEQYCEYLQLKQENQQLKDRIDKAIEYINDNTKYFDSEYAEIYGTLCDIAGAGDTRIHCVVGDEQLLEILKGDVHNGQDL